MVRFYSADIRLVYAISKALGHANIKVTENYLKGFDEAGIDAKMDELF